jgi:murein DD-endopeptidase MepM/ murein hydrolase activator NlpD
LPALLLAVPSASLAGLWAIHGTAPAHLAHVRLAAQANTQPVALGSARDSGAASGLSEPPSLDPKPVTAATRAARPRPARASRARSAPAWVLPASGSLSSRFGPRWGSFHPGIDIAAPTGDPIKTAAAGVVTTAGWGGGYGNVVRVQHPGGITTVYAHMSRIDVTPGQSVATGELLGQIGSTGFSTGPHLHFEVRVDDQAIDPLPWLHEHGVTFYGEATDAGSAAASSAHAQD